MARRLPGRIQVVLGTLVSREGLAMLLLAAVYAFVGRLGLSLAVVNPSASPVWPPTGIAIAALLLGGRRIFPAILLGAFIVNFTANGGILASAAIAIGNTLEAVVAVTLINGVAGGRGVFASARGVFLYAVLAAGLATMVSATVGVLSLLATHSATLASAPAVWLTWWLGDATGAVAVAPLIILWVQDPHPGPLKRQWLEAGCLLLAIGGVGLAVFDGAVFEHHGYPLGFLALPLVVWAALRFGAREAATATAFLSVIALAGTFAGKGLFAQVGGNESMLLLQIFFAITALTGLAIAAVDAERRAALDRLARAHDELEVHVAERTASLEAAMESLQRSNRELEEFAYVASHDLQEPLRAVAGYSQLLLRRNATQLDADGLAFATYAAEGAGRMQALIKDLLSLARLGSPPLVPTQLSQALADALKDHEAAVKATRARITHDPLPTVMGDPGQLVQLFGNLIGNAVKFHHRERPPAIHVAAHRTGPLWTVSVADNGIGIESEHFQRIFQVFQRLHGRTEYPGSGIGLAICKKVVERHGGRIWVESRPGEGSTFFFTLRAVPADAIVRDKPTRAANS